MAVKLTVKHIDAVKPGQHVIRLRDTSVTGLNITVTPNGGKAFYLQYSSPETGKRRFKKLGIYPGYSLADARADAGDLHKLIDKRIDPIEEDKRIDAAAAAELGKEQEAAAQAVAGSVSALFELYLADLEQDGKHTKDVKDAFEKDIRPMIGNRRAREITRHDIADVLATIVDRGAIRKAGLVRGYLHRAFNLGIEAETSVRWRKKYRDTFKLDYNPVTPVKLPEGKSKPGNRVLSEAEVKKFWVEAGATLIRKDSAIALKLILSTGQRVQEILEARWTEFDLGGKQWTIPFERRKIRHKSEHREPHIVPLTDLHIGLLGELQVLSGDSPYLFPKQTGNAPRTHNSLQQAVVRYCVVERTATKDKYERFPRFSPRDLRRTMKTLSGKAGIGKEVRDRLQGHAFQDVSSKNYDRYDYWPEKQQAMEQWCHYLETMVSDKQDETVVPFRNGGAA